MADDDGATGEVEQEVTGQEAEPKPTETVEFWKAQARENEKRAKANADAAKRLNEIEDANKTELQKVAERAEAAERRAAEFESKALRTEVAAAKGVPLAGLTGSTKEELEASADALLAWRDASASTTKPAPPDPKSLKSGASGNGTAEKGRAAAALRALRNG